MTSHPRVRARIGLLLLAACVHTGLVPGVARATTTWVFTGVVRTLTGGRTTFPPELTSLGIDVGVPITARWVLDETTEPVPIATGFLYPGATVGGEIVVGSLTISLLDGGLLDALAVNIQEPGATFGNRIAGYAPIPSIGPISGFAFFELLDALPADAILTPDFPALPPPLSALDPFPTGRPPPVYTRLGFSGDHTFLTVNAEITSIGVILEPSGAVLFAIGLAIARSSMRRPPKP